MQTTTLRKVGGSIMMTIPPALLEELRLAAGSTVALEVEGKSLIVKPSHRRYTAEGTPRGLRCELFSYRRRTRVA